MRMWESKPPSGQMFQQLSAEAEARATVATASVQYPLLPCRDGGLPSASCNVKESTAAQVALRTRNEPQHHHNHASTLEMISAMAHAPPSVAPECVQGVEISIPAKQPRPTSSSPRRIWTSHGMDHRATNGDGDSKREIPSLCKLENAQEDAEGGATRRAAAPCNTLLKSLSWAGGDERIDTGSRHEGVALQLLSEHRQGRGGDDQRETSCAEDLQLHVKDISRNLPPPSCAVTGLGLSFLAGRAGGAGTGVRGEDKQRWTTPFSR